MYVRMTFKTIRSIRLSVLALVAGVLTGVTAHPSTGRAARDDDAQVLANCPAGGDARSATVRALNELKRRINGPTSRDLDLRVTLAAMVAPGDDTARWSEQRGATIEGYVAGVKIGGVESVNCHTHDPNYRDTHIELTLDPMKGDERTYVIVEVTPQIRQVMARNGVDWSTKALRRTLLGRWVRVTGWMLFDEEHKPNATNTASGGAHIWRATVWEIHPITSLEVLAGKPK